MPLKFEYNNTHVTNRLSLFVAHRCLVGANAAVDVMWMPMLMQTPLLLMSMMMLVLVLTSVLTLTVLCVWDWRGTNCCQLHRSILLQIT